MRKSIGMALVLLMGLIGGSSTALAQQAGIRQYAPDTMTDTGDGNSTPDLPAGNVAGEGGGGANNSMTPGSANNARGRRSSGSGPAVPATDNSVAFLQFGVAQKGLQDDVETALSRAGLRVRFLGQSPVSRLKAFLGSAEAKALSADGPKAVGRALGAQLVNPTPALTAAFPRVFGDTTTFSAVTRAVLTRRQGLSDDEVAFQLGVAEGLESSGIPVAYAEESNVDPSHVKDYARLDVPTVGDVDTDAGKLRLGQILLRTGQFANIVGTDRTAAEAELKPPGGGGGVAPYALLAGLLGSLALWVVLSARTSRRPMTARR